MQLDGADERYLVENATSSKSRPTFSMCPVRSRVVTGSPRRGSRSTTPSTGAVGAARCRARRRRWRAHSSSAPPGRRAPQPLSTAQVPCSTSEQARSSFIGTGSRRRWPDGYDCRVLVQTQRIEFDLLTRRVRLVRVTAGNCDANGLPQSYRVDVGIPAIHKARGRAALEAEHLTIAEELHVSNGELFTDSISAFVHAVPWAVPRHTQELHRH